MNAAELSRQYEVRKLRQEDIPEIFELCRRNTLYYQFCPPFVTEESIAGDMRALPPGKTCADKYYLGWYDGRSLTAVMDLILNYPDEKTAFIGFFMVDVPAQGTGTGSAIIRDAFHCLREYGFARVRLGWVRGNPQASRFWRKNGFRETGVTSNTGRYTILYAERALL